MNHRFTKVLSMFLCVILIIGTAPFVEFYENGLFQHANAASYQVGDLIQFGTYPQSRVTDIALIAKLDSVVKTWASYGYYSGTGSWDDGNMQPSDYMKFADFFYRGIKYRAVSFTEYRPCCSGYKKTATVSGSNSSQNKNGYAVNTIYYFTYLPIIWRVLDPLTGLVLCDNIIDNQMYNNTSYYSGFHYQDKTTTYYSNDYATSSIRTWLNQDFYNTSFSPVQKDNICMTTLDNSAFSSSYSMFDSASTDDKIFLLSFSSAINSNYGFSTNYKNDDSARTTQATDYAKCQGLGFNTENGCSSWWLRNPARTSSGASCVRERGRINYNNGDIDYGVDADFSLGVRPACILSNLKSDVSLSVSLYSNPNSIDSSKISFTSTENELEYPIYTKSSFANQLMSWVDSSEYKNIFTAFTDTVSYQDMLNMTIDVPIKTADGMPLSLVGGTKVKDAMAYLIFANAAQQYTQNTLDEVRNKINAGKDGAAYQYFLSQIKNFAGQYYYFQNALNGKDAFSQTLIKLLLANTAIQLVKEAKITYTSEQTEYIILHKDAATIDDYIDAHSQEITSTIKGSSVSYFTDLYKANVSESPDFYDDVTYFLMSGGDTTYLNPSFQETIAEYNRLLKGANVKLKNLKHAYEDDSFSLSSNVSLALDELSYYAKKYHYNKAADVIGTVKNLWGWANNGYDLIKASTSGSLFSVYTAAWSLSNKYINEVKKVYTKAQSSEAGWYALAYYYLQNNNEALLNAMIDPNTGSAQFRINSLVSYGFPRNTYDVIENSIVKRWYGDGYDGAFLNHTYTPNEAFRSYLWKASNDLSFINSLDCVAYKDMLLQYILAELNLRKNISGVPASLTVTSNNIDFGTVNAPLTATLGTNVTVTAIPAANCYFIGWVNPSTGTVVSIDTSYTFTITADVALQARFAAIPQPAAQTPVIDSQPTGAQYALGQTISPLTVSASVSDGGNVTYQWYSNTANSNTGGTPVGTGTSYTPELNGVGTRYYYVVVTNTSPNDASNTSSVRSNTAAVRITDPVITGIRIQKVPTKLDYYVGDTVDPSGMIVAADLSDGTSFSTDAYRLTYQLKAVGTAIVTVYAYGFSAAFSVNVSECDACAGGHTIVADEAVPATCSSRGLSEGSHCSVCGAVLEAQATLPPTDHTPGETVREYTQPATCTEDGFYDDNVYCTNCGLLLSSETIDIPATGHSFGEWTSVDETEHQRVCAVDVTHTETAPHEWDEGVITLPATCIAEGTLTFSCSVCGATREEAISMVPHSEAIIVGTPATCTEDGLTDGVQCSVCGTILEAQEIIPALGHKFGEWTLIQEATCSEPGIEQRVCENDSTHVETRTVEQEGHQFGPWIPYDNGQHQRICTSNENHVEFDDHIWGEGVVTKESSCSEYGILTYTCPVCGATKTDAIPKTEHIYDDGTETLAPTCLEYGVKTFHCLNCDQTVEEAIEKAPHNWDEGNITLPPTCTEEGVVTYTCTVCREEKTQELPTVSHIDENIDGNCDYCGLSFSSFCPLCGKVHSDSIVDRFISFFHRIVIFFTAMRPH